MRNQGLGPPGKGRSIEWVGSDGGRRRLGEAGPTTGPNSSPGKKKRHLGGNKNCALTALLSVAFILSVGTMFIISPTISRSIVAFESNMNMDLGHKEEETSSVLASKNKNKHHGHDKHTTSIKLPPEAPRKKISDLITWILSDHDKDSQTQHSALERLKDSPQISFEFEPGSLSLSHAQTLKHCFADPKVYVKHVQGGRGDGSNVPVSYSKKHKLAYVMLPKSGSSTSRYMLKNKYQASETSLPLRPSYFQTGGNMEGVEVITFVRDPLSRFYSQYDEAYVRTAPWQRKLSHPFPYLFDNLHTYHDYEDVFCPVSTRKNRKECLFRPSQENGTLTSRFERFVQEYDGRDPWDIHLTLQVPMMSSIDGMPLHMTQVYNTSDSKEGWKRIANQFLGEDATPGEDDGSKDGGVISGRSYPRRFNSDLVSIPTQRRICELALLDYCCLNLKLPDVCKGAHFRGDDNRNRELFCLLDRTGRIQPGIFPSKAH